MRIKFIKIVLMLIAAVWTCTVLYWLTYDVARWVASSFWEESTPQVFAVEFLGKHGDKNDAYRMIYYIRDLSESTIIFNENENVIRLYKRYPRSRKAYLAAIVYAILDKETKHYNRVLLIELLSEITNIYFGYCMTYWGGEEQIPDSARPVMERGLENVRRWWAGYNSGDMILEKNTKEQYLEDENICPPGFRLPDYP